MCSLIHSLVFSSKRRARDLFARRRSCSHDRAIDRSIIIRIRGTRMRIKATGSFRRYFYHGPAVADDELLARLARLRFQDIDQQPSAAYAGWITLRSLVDTHFDDEIWRAHYACFALRIDRKRLPKNALKVRML